MKRKGSVNTRFPLARIKKIIQKNEEIGKIAHSVPFLVAKGLEHFLEQILTKIGDEFPNNCEKLSPSHLKQVIKKEPNYEFLMDLFREVQDLDEVRCKKPKVAKRKVATKELDFGNEIRPNVQKKLKTDSKQDKTQIDFDVKYVDCSDQSD